MRESFYITTAIDYANGPPHLGHAFEKIGADVLARYHRLSGKSVFLLCGLDEHGLKVEQTAAANDTSPGEWVDKIAEKFISTWQRLNISYDDFIRTTEERHKKAVRELIHRMTQKGDLYRAKYVGLYCVGCEGYKTESDLVEGACPYHLNRPVEKVEEENWFFRMSKYKNSLREIVLNGSFILPESRRNEVAHLLDNLSDISVSRKGVKWGIEWPGTEEETVYVWIDALTNYLSATGFPGEDTRGLWPADLHVVGKDITRFHALYWPAMLLSADVDLPTQVWGHGFVQVSGERLGKSSGTRISLDDLMDRYGADVLRFYLMREIPWGGDGEISLERFDVLYESALANNLGNLLNRVTSMIDKYRSGIVPGKGNATVLDTRREEFVEEYHSFMNQKTLHEALRTILTLSSEANAFIVREEPWKLFRTGNKPELDGVLYSLVKTLAVVASLVYPFMPNASLQIVEALGGDIKLLPVGDVQPGSTVKGRIIFPRTSA